MTVIFRSSMDLQRLLALPSVLHSLFTVLVEHL
jgi:hypothetical protein